MDDFGWDVEGPAFALPLRVKKSVMGLEGFAGCFLDVLLIVGL